MCSKCESFVGLPIDRKAKVMLFDESDKAVDCRRFVGFMEKNHEDDGTPYAFIKQEVEIKSTGRSYGVSINISHCPFCGENILR